MELKTEPEFFISELSVEYDDSFILGITNKDNIEKLYTVEIALNSHGELVRLKSVKKS